MPHSWIINSLKMYKLSHEDINFIGKNMKTMRVELTEGGINLAEGKIQRGIFQGDALSPLQLTWCHLSANSENAQLDTNLVDRRKKNQSLNVHGWHQTIYENWIELKTLIHAVRIFSQDIRIEFDIEKCAMLVMKSGILEADTIKQVEMKVKIQNEYLRRPRKLLETKLSNRNLIKGINAWAVPLVRYSGLFLKWTRDKLKQTDQRTKKLMTMHKVLHPRDDVDRVYVSWNEGGRGLTSIEDSVDASIQWLEDYIQIHDGGLITAIGSDTNNTMDNRMTITRKQK